MWTNSKHLAIEVRTVIHNKKMRVNYENFIELYCSSVWGLRASLQLLIAHALSAIHYILFTITDCRHWFLADRDCRLSIHSYTSL